MLQRKRQLSVCSVQETAALSKELLLLEPLSKACELATGWHAC